jgi:hypothetical protein
MRTKLLDVITIKAFTPVKDKGDIKDQFCHKLEQECDSMPVNDI